jgi:hypothetical protein
LVLGSPAYRAFPGIRKVFKRSPGGNSIVRVSLCGVINVTTNGTGVLFHFLAPLVDVIQLLLSLPYVSPSIAFLVMSQRYLKFYYR